MKLFWDKPNLPVEWWLGGGLPLNPFLHALVVLYLVERLRPKEPVLPPVELFQQSGMCDFLEWSLMRSWMVSWLSYLQWYCTIALSPGLTLHQLFEGGPVVTLHWNIKRKDSNLVRLGLQWKCYSLI